ncbi:hypothetical protein ACFLVI_03450 [Chloroflexota bacterium]
MKNQLTKIEKKHLKIAQKFKENTIDWYDDQKRHDRIQRSEAKAMLRAQKDGLSPARIGLFFDRDLRSVSKALEGFDDYKPTTESQSIEKVVRTTINPGETKLIIEDINDKVFYFDIPVRTNDLLINSITVSTSQPDSPYQFLIFEREQLADKLSRDDIFWNEPSSGHRQTFIQPKPPRYQDVDGCGNIHCGIVHEGGWRELIGDEFVSPDPITFTVELVYRPFTEPT